MNKTVKTKANNHNITKNVLKSTNIAKNTMKLAIQMMKYKLVKKQNKAISLMKLRI